MLATIDHRGAVQLVASSAYPLPDLLRNQILKITEGGATPLSTLGEVDHRLGVVFADAVLHLLVSALSNAPAGQRTLK